MVILLFCFIFVCGGRGGEGEEEGGLCVKVNVAEILLGT